MLSIVLSDISSKQSSFFLKKIILVATLIATKLVVYGDWEEGCPLSCISIES